MQKDVEIALRDGARLYADVLRPAGSGRLPALINNRSPGRTDPLSLHEAVRFCDAIGWAGRQSRCNGAIGFQR